MDHPVAATIYLLISLFGTGDPPQVMGTYPTKETCQKALPEMNAYVPTYCSDAVVDVKVADALRQSTAEGEARLAEYHRMHDGKPN